MPMRGRVLSHPLTFLSPLFPESLPKAWGKGQAGRPAVEPGDWVVTGMQSHCREQQPPPHRALSEALAGPAPQ